MQNNKHKFSEIIFQNYLETVNNSKILEINYSPNNSQNELTNKLFRCKVLAQQEFITCHHEIVSIFNSILEIENDINKDIDTIKTKHHFYEDNWKDVFIEFNFLLTQILNHANEKLIDSFEKKIDKIDTFSICLFGRTKVGKSTTMEALTKGSGISIGIGKQDTTKTSTEYIWNGLKVIDTPGINSIHDDKQLENLALSYADEADLIAFLLPHQIEEGDFDKFKLFYKQNKPIIILLNVKGDTGEEGSKTLEMFLKNSDSLFEENKIIGYRNRINDFIFKTLEISSGLIPIIPIHSKSAFLSYHIKDEKISNQLYDISNFKNLEKELIKEVTEFGELYRIKNPHDTVQLFSSVITSKLSEFHSNLLVKQNLFEKNANKFIEVKNLIFLKQNEIIRRNIITLFENKLKSVSAIVDEIFSTKKEEDRKKIVSNFIDEDEIRIRMTNSSAEIQKVIQKEITEYFNNFAKEINILDIQQKKSSYYSSIKATIGELDNLKSQVNFIEGAGVVTSAISGIGLAIVAAEGAILGAEGTLFGLGGANIWNPVGWGLIAAGVILAIVGGVAHKKHINKVKEAKNKAIMELKYMIYKTETNIIENIKNSIDKVIKTIKTEHIDLMDEYVKHSNKYLSQTSKLISQIDKTATFSEKQKFQSMINNILNSESFTVENIFHSNHNINIQLNDLPSSISTIQNILSRVEEKQIIISKL